MVVSPRSGANPRSFKNCVSQKVQGRVHHVIHTMLARVDAWQQSFLQAYHSMDQTPNA